MIHLRGAVSLFSLVVVTLAASAGDASKGLKYQFKAGESYVYNVTIVAEMGDTTETNKGTIQLVTKSADAAAMQLTPSVNLSKSYKSKAPRGIPPRPPFSPPSFGAREVTVDPFGKVLRSSGETSLPYLLGSAGELVIEPLSSKGEQRWTRERDIVIREQQRGFTFGPRPGNETNTSAHETITCEITGASGGLTQIKKTYELKTAAADGDSRIHFQGTGDLAFDTKAGVLKTGEFKGAIVVNEKNVQLRIPLTVSYRLMDAAEVATAKQEQQERSTKAQQAFKEANTPKAVDESEIVSALADLKSKNIFTFMKATDRLAKAIPIESKREEVAGQLAGHMKELRTRMHAAKALKVWGTDKAVTPLLKDLDWVVRLDACKILAEVGTKEALPALRSAQSDPNGSVVFEAGRAIKAVEGRK